MPESWRSIPPREPPRHFSEFSEPKAKISFRPITAWVCFHALHCRRLVHWFQNKFRFSILFKPKFGTKFQFVMKFSERVFGIFGTWSENFAFGRNFGFVPKFSERVPEPKAKILFWTITAWVCFHALHCSKLVHWFRNEFWFSVLFGPKLGTKFQFVLKFSECVFGIFGTWSENFVSTHHYLSLLSYVAKNLNQRNILTPVGTQSENFILTHHCLSLLSCTALQ